MGAGTGTAATETPRARSTLESVVVHSAGAVCTRRARFALPADGGSATLRIDGLPPTLYERSLRGRVVSGPPGLTVTDVRLSLQAEPRPAGELPGPLLDLEDAQDRRTRLRDRCDRLRAEIEEVAAWRAEPPQPRRGDPPRWAPVESMLSLAGFVDSRLALLHERLCAAEEELERAGHDVDVLTRRLDQASTALHTGRVEPSFSAVLTLTRDGDGDGDGSSEAGAHDADGVDREDGARPATEAEPAPVELELEYHVPGATWAPVYQLRLDGGSGGGVLVLRACVAQRTGEDWTGVRLGLSTADLLRRSDLPELRSLRIGRSQEEPRASSWREPPAGLEELFAGYDAATPRTPQLPPGVRPMPAPHAPAVGSVPPPAPAAAAPPGEDRYGAAFGAAVPAGPVPAPGASPPRAQAAPGAAPHAAPARRAARDRTQGAPLTAPLSPAQDMLDYARLTLAGPDSAHGRGTLRPETPDTDPVVTEYRRRAEEVTRLARPAHAVDVRLSAGSFDYRFDTAAPADVEADGVWHTVPVCEVRARMEPEYVCVPSVDPSVYGTVVLTNTSPHALLAGPADVVVNGDFVLTAALPTLAPGERQAVGMGVVESVQVTRRTHMRESTAGLRGGTTVLDHTVEVEVANRLPHPVVLEVRERVPVSTDKDVRVEEHPAVPPWTAQERPMTGQESSYVRGARAWRVELEPGRTATLTGGFEIRLPAGKTIVGGNRRN
jgi:Domain of unknown function (DUF4139)/N-terminal domain of unknown function (DUF4140)